MPKSAAFISRIASLPSSTTQTPCTKPPRRSRLDPALKGNYAFSFVSGCFTCNQLGWEEPDPGVFCHPLNDTVLTGLCSQLVKQHRLLIRMPGRALPGEPSAGWGTGLGRPAACSAQTPALQGCSAPTCAFIHLSSPLPLLPHPAQSKAAAVNRH